MANPGQVVIINGPSSAGKTSVVLEFCRRRAEAGQWWLPISVDDFQIRTPPAFFAAPGLEGPYADQGFWLEPAGGGVTVVPGPGGRRLHQAFHRTVRVWAEQGFDVICDEAVFDQAAAQDWRVALEGLRCTWVALHCDLEVLEARERSRPDRVPGIARGLASVVFSHIDPDLTLDSTTAGPEALADTLWSALEAGA